LSKGHYVLRRFSNALVKSRDWFWLSLCFRGGRSWNVLVSCAWDLLLLYSLLYFTLLVLCINLILDLSQSKHLTNGEHWRDGWKPSQGSLWSNEGCELSRRDMGFVCTAV